MSKLTSINFKKWIEEHRSLLKPPVGNAQVWKDTEFIIMVVGGPNNRKDYHVDPGEEFFYQLEGDMVLKIVEDGIHKDISINEGEIFLLPPFMPHSPQRKAETIGLVVERTRHQDEKDKFIWYCEFCNTLLHTVEVSLIDITTQLKPIFDNYWSNVEARTCTKCGSVMQSPELI